jgi:predicted metal-binding membrane protein
MLLAMMPPLLTQPLAHLWDRSFSRYRWSAIALFVTGYGAVWMLAGLVLMAAAIVAGVLSARFGLSPLVPATGLALLWQCCPAKQICLNCCHRLPRLSPFGLAAHADSLRYGLVSAVWCVGACWALMLIPLVAQSGHLPVMAAASVLMLAERFAQARPARWGWPAAPMP